jgi:iron complex transport system permease protein
MTISGQELADAGSSLPQLTEVPTTRTPLEKRPGGILHRPTGRLLGLLVLLVVLVFMVMLSLAVGARSIPLRTVVHTFTQQDLSDPEQLIVFSLRGPRTVIALMVGIALGLAGTCMQGVSRNPLADPGLLGVNAGAALAVVLGIYVLGVTSVLGYVWFAFAGAAIVSVLVYALGSIGREGATPVKLALAGAAITALLASFTTLILLIDREALDQYRFWVAGSFAGRPGILAVQVMPFIVVGAVMALVSGRVLNALSLGDDVARSLGQRVGLARLYSATSIVILAGAATAAAGPVGFVGLTIPHVARSITGPDYRWVLSYAFVMGPILLLAADIIGRVVVRPGELQVGIVTALIGAPFFIALVRRKKLAEL